MMNTLKTNSSSFLVKNKSISKKRRLKLLNSNYRLIGNVWFNPEHWALHEGKDRPKFTFFHIDEFKTGLTIKFEGIKFDAKTKKANDFVKSHVNKQIKRLNNVETAFGVDSTRSLH